MISRSKIRQAALHLVYAVQENGGDTVGFPFDLFWEIAQEKDVDHFVNAQAKAIVHACRASRDSARLLGERAQAALDALHGDLTASRLREDIERYSAQSAVFDAALAAQRLCMDDKRRDGSGQLDLCNRDVLRLAAAVEGLGRALLPTLPDFPVYRSVLDPLAALLRRRGRMLALCAALATPGALEGQGDYAPLIRSAETLERLRPAAERLALGVLAHRAEYDARIDAQLHHFTTERLDAVDRCILYLSLYEMEENGLEMPIVISEATALADTYSGSRSAPFIHGILAALHRVGKS